MLMANLVQQCPNSEYFGPRIGQDTWGQLDLPFLVVFNITHADMIISSKLALLYAIGAIVVERECSS